MIPFDLKLFPESQLYFQFELVSPDCGVIQALCTARSLYPLQKPLSQFSAKVSKILLLFAPAYLAT